MTVRAMLPMYLLALTVGCGAESDGPGGGSVPGGPVVSALTSSAPTITDGESITFTAVVTDPDGQSDITLGRLEDTTGNVHYGDFAPSGDNEFTITIDWASIHQASAIELTAPMARTFRAEFTDVAGHVGTRDLAIQLTCGADAACAGACTDTTTSTDSCGSCGHACPVVDTYGGCQASSCLPTLSACVESPAGMSCDQICAAGSGTCAVAACGGVTAIGYAGCAGFNSTSFSDDPCAEPLSNVFGAVRCCCTVP